jgi:hypothetical protein
MAHRTHVCYGVVTAALMIAGCDVKPAARSKSTGTPPPWFEEVAMQRGVKFIWRSCHGDRYFMPECIGGGGGMFDMDNDGDLDLYLVQAGSLADPSRNEPNILLRNDGKGFFEPVTGPGAAGDRGYGMGLACGDYDNDGDIDLYVTNLGPNVLYQNDGHGSFTDVTAAAGVGCGGWSSSAAFVDYDNDGDLDLYVCRYINWSIATELKCYNDMGAPDYCAPANYNAPALDVLYRNNSDGTFTDVTVQAGLDAWSGNGLGVVCGDFDRNGWIDIFVANDGTRNQLWANQGNGAFIDVGLQTGCALDLDGKAKAGMGTHAADIDNDSDLDLIVCNLRRESDSIFMNQGEHFSDETTAVGLRVTSQPFTRFGVGWIDFDNDGLLDLYEANGLVMRDDRPFSDDPYAQPNLLFRGRRSERGGPFFEEVQPRGGTAAPLVATSRAAAFGDIDNDGGADVLVINRDGPAQLLRNIAPNRGHWVILRVLDEHNRDAYGATVSLRVGDRIVTRDVKAAYSYLASNDPRVHVGTGVMERIDDVTIRWVDGAVESFGSLMTDQIHTLRRGKGD